MTVADNPWLNAALAVIERGETCVLVTIAQTRGSTPREPGAKMLVWSDGLAGTVGGGHLEFKAITAARAMLSGSDPRMTHIEQFSLGPQLAQCCGGGAALLFEKISRDSAFWLKTWTDMARSGKNCVVLTNIGSDPGAKTFIEPDTPWNGVPAAIADRAKALMIGRSRCALVQQSAATDCYMIETVRPLVDHLYLFGAGHVGKAVVRALEPLPFRITWIDGRDGVFPDGLSPHVRAVQSSTPPLAVDEAPAETFFLVMTHSHPLDLEICARVLQRNDFAYLGLIGSETKRARFAGRLRAIGIPTQALAQLTCPIGIHGIAGKEPPAIAASVAAQLLMIAERRQQTAKQAPIMALGGGS